MSRFPIVIRLLAAVVTVVFGLQDIAWAAVAAGTVPNPTAGAAIQRVRIPDAIALLDGTHDAGIGSPLVILIQDAHTNPSAQINISRLLDLLVHDENISTVYLEGGKGDVSLGGFRSSATDAARRSAGLSLLKKGLLQGAEFFNLTSDRPFTLWGVENRALYDRALRTYRRTVDTRKSSLAFLAKIDSAYAVLRDRTYGPELLEWEKIVSEHAEQDGSTVGFAQQILSRLERAGLPSDSYPKLKTLTKLDANASAFKMDVVLVGLKEITAAALKPSPEGLSDPAERTMAEEFASGQFADEEAANAVCDTLIAFMSRADAARTDAAEEALRYLRHRKRVREFINGDLIGQIAAAAEKITDGLVRTEEERRLTEIGRMIKTWRSAIELKLDSGSYERLKNAPRHLSPEGVMGHLNRRILDLGRYHEKTILRDASFERSLRLAQEFYELALRRDRIFWGAMRLRMRSQNERKSVLVAGGYHSEHLKRILRASGVSYVSFIPRAAHATDSARYEKILLAQAQQNGRRQRGARSAISTLQVNAAGNSAARMALQQALGEGSLDDPEHRTVVAGRTNLPDPGQEQVLHAPGWLSRQRANTRRTLDHLNMIWIEFRLVHQWPFLGTSVAAVQDKLSAIALRAETAEERQSLDGVLAAWLSGRTSIDLELNRWGASLERLVKRLPGRSAAWAVVLIERTLLKHRRSVRSEFYLKKAAVRTVRKATLMRLAGPVFDTVLSPSELWSTPHHARYNELVREVIDAAVHLKERAQAQYSDPEVINATVNEGFVRLIAFDGSKQFDELTHGLLNRAYEPAGARMADLEETLDALRSRRDEFRGMRIYDWIQDLQESWTAHSRLMTGYGSRPRPEFFIRRAQGLLYTVERIHPDGAPLQIERVEPAVPRPEPYGDMSSPDLARMIRGDHEDIRQIRDLVPVIDDAMARRRAGALRDPFAAASAYLNGRLKFRKKQTRATDTLRAIAGLIDRTLDWVRQTQDARAADPQPLDEWLQAINDHILQYLEVRETWLGAAEEELSRRQLRVRNMFREDLSGVDAAAQEREPEQAVGHLMFLVPELDEHAAIALREADDPNVLDAARRIRQIARRWNALQENAGISPEEDPAFDYHHEVSIIVQDLVTALLDALSDHGARMAGMPDGYDPRFVYPRSRGILLDQDPRRENGPVWRTSDWLVRALEPNVKKILEALGQPKEQARTRLVSAFSSMTPLELEAVIFYLNRDWRKHAFDIQTGDLEILAGLLTNAVFDAEDPIYQELLRAFPTAAHLTLSNMIVETGMPRPTLGNLIEFYTELRELDVSQGLETEITGTDLSAVELSLTRIQKTIEIFRKRAGRLPRSGQGARMAAGRSDLSDFSLDGDDFELLRASERVGTTPRAAQKVLTEQLARLVALDLSGEAASGSAAAELGEQEKNIAASSLVPALTDLVASTRYDLRWKDRAAQNTGNEARVRDLIGAQIKKLMASRRKLETRLVRMQAAALAPAEEVMLIPDQGEAAQAVRTAAERLREIGLRLTWLQTMNAAILLSAARDADAELSVGGVPVRGALNVHNGLRRRQGAASSLRGALTSVSKVRALTASLRSEAELETLLSEPGPASEETSADSPGGPSLRATQGGRVKLMSRLAELRRAVKKAGQPDAGATVRTINGQIGSIVDQIASPRREFGQADAASRRRLQDLLRNVMAGASDAVSAIADGRADAAAARDTFEAAYQDAREQIPETYGWAADHSFVVPIVHRYRDADSRTRAITRRIPDSVRAQLRATQGWRLLLQSLLSMSGEEPGDPAALRHYQIRSFEAVRLRGEKGLTMEWKEVQRFMSALVAELGTGDASDRQIELSEEQKEILRSVLAEVRTRREALSSILGHVKAEGGAHSGARMADAPTEPQDGSASAASIGEAYLARLAEHPEEQRMLSMLAHWIHVKGPQTGPIFLTAEGPGSLAVPLLQKEGLDPGRLYLNDFEPGMLATARSRMQELGYTPEADRLRAGNILDPSVWPPTKMSVITNSLFVNFLSPSDRRAYWALAKEHLAPGGIFVTAVQSVDLMDARGLLSIKDGRLPYLPDLESWHDTVLEDLLAEMRADGWDARIEPGPTVRVTSSEGEIYTQNILAVIVAVPAESGARMAGSPEQELTPQEATWVRQLFQMIGAHDALRALQTYLSGLGTDEARQAADDRLVRAVQRRLIASDGPRVNVTVTDQLSGEPADPDQLTALSDVLSSALNGDVITFLSGVRSGPRGTVLRTDARRTIIETLITNPKVYAGVTHWDSTLLGLLETAYKRQSGDRRAWVREAFRTGAVAEIALEDGQAAGIVDAMLKEEWATRGPEVWHEDLVVSPDPVTVHGGQAPSVSRSPAGRDLVLAERIVPLEWYGPTDQLNLERAVRYGLNMVVLPFKSGSDDRIPRIFDENEVFTVREIPATTPLSSTAIFGHRSPDAYWVRGDDQHAEAFARRLVRVMKGVENPFEFSSSGQPALVFADPEQLIAAKKAASSFDEADRRLLDDVRPVDIQKRAWADEPYFTSRFKGKSFHAILLLGIPAEFDLETGTSVPGSDPLRMTDLWLEKKFRGKRVLVIGPENDTLKHTVKEDNLVEAFRRVGVEADGLSPHVSDAMVRTGRYHRFSASDMTGVADDSYDVIVSVGGLYDPSYLDVIFYKKEEEQKAFIRGSLSEIHRVLRPGGSAFIQISQEDGNPDAYSVIERSKHFFFLDYRQFPRPGLRHTPMQTVWELINYKPSAPPAAARLAVEPPDTWRPDANAAALIQMAVDAHQRFLASQLDVREDWSHLARAADFAVQALERIDASGQRPNVEAVRPLIPVLQARAVDRAKHDDLEVGAIETALRDWRKEPVEPNWLKVRSALRAALDVRRSSEELAERVAEGRAPAELLESYRGVRDALDTVETALNSAPASVGFWRRWWHGERPKTIDASAVPAKSTVEHARDSRVLESRKKKIAAFYAFLKLVRERSDLRAQNLYPQDAPLASYREAAEWLAAWKIFSASQAQIGSAQGVFAVNGWTAAWNRFKEAWNPWYPGPYEDGGRTETSAHDAEPARAVPENVPPSAAETPVGEPLVDVAPETLGPVGPGEVNEFAADVVHAQPAGLAQAVPESPAEIAIEFEAGQVHWLKLWRVEQDGQWVAEIAGVTWVIEKGKGANETSVLREALSSDLAAVRLRQTADPISGRVQLSPEEWTRIQEALIRSYSRPIDLKSLPGAHEQGVVVLHLDGLIGGDSKASRRLRLKSLAESVRGLDLKRTAVVLQGSPENVEQFRALFPEDGLDVRSLFDSLQGLPGEVRAVHVMSRADRAAYQTGGAPDAYTLRAFLFEDIVPSEDQSVAVHLYRPGLVAAQALSRLSGIDRGDEGLRRIYDYLVPYLPSDARTLGVDAFSRFLGGDYSPHLMDSFSFHILASLDIGNAIKFYALGARLAGQSA